MEDNNAVQHPAHYRQYDVEVLDMMLAIWGEEETISFCKLNAFKYRMRAGHKGSIEEDLAKEKFYLDYIKRIQAKNVPCGCGKEDDRLEVIRTAVNLASTAEEAIKAINNSLWGEK